MKKLKAMGFEVIAVAPKDEYSEALEKEGFLYFEIKNLDRKGKNPLKDLRLFLEYFNLYKRIKPNLVINYTIKPNIYGALACGVLRIPSISVITGLGYTFIRKNWLTELIKILCRLAFRFNSYVLFLNREDMETLKDFVRDKAVLILSEGINTEHFNPDFCSKGRENPEKFVFLYVGRFLKDKGIIELIKAGEKLYEERKDFEIWLLGSLDSGNPQSLTEDEMKNLEKLPFVKFLPFAKDVRPFICNADCVVLPSYYREGVPRSLLEAMAMEKPIITTDAPGCRETCREGVNGFLVKPRDIDNLYQAMKNMLFLDRTSREKMGKEGRKLVVEKFDEKIIVNKYIEIIQSILKN